jgi:hypothetical protein
MMRYGFIFTILAATAAAPACSSSLDTPTSSVDAGVNNLPPAQSTTGGSGDTFDHDNDQISPWDLVNRLEVEGPPSFTSHMHDCSKIRYGNLGRVLASLGVNTTNTTQLSAGELYTDGFTAMGGPDFADRVRESIDISTSQASREFDIFAAAAPEIITALPTLARCQVNGVGPTLFNASNQCNIDAISCMIGSTATTDHVDLCNLAVTSSSTVAIGQKLAVASLLAAAYTCE